MSKVAAVVGGTGYVGSHIVARLVAGGYTVKCGTRNPAGAAWLQDLAHESISLHELDLGPPASEVQMDILLEGCQSVFLCAGFEKQEPATITFMVEAALATLRAAKRNGVAAVVLTSSGGSTNPAGLDPATPKNELIHWSDPEAQQAAGKFSPAAKTLMEMAALKEVGRDQSNKVVDEEQAAGSPRLVIMNPNLILGPQLQPGNISGNSLPWISRILQGCHPLCHYGTSAVTGCAFAGKAMSEKIPNDSMSIIDVRDLASLHVAAAENPDASGRYWGVNRSWPWEEILAILEEVAPGYMAPPRFEGEAKLPTQFDHTRQQSLGVKLRPLKDTLADLVAFLQARGEYQPPKL